jgi:hypothetical protein
MSAKEYLERCLRTYERIHARYMATSVFTDEGKAIKLALGLAREQYMRAYKDANPTHIVF